MRHKDDRQRAAAREAQDRRPPGDTRRHGVGAPLPPGSDDDRGSGVPGVAPTALIRALRLLFVALAAVALVGCGSSSNSDTTTPSATVAEGSSGVVLVSPEKAQALIDGGAVTLLDVRTPDEFAAGHIAGAENIDFYAADFGARIDALDPKARYVVYCHSGNRSGQATALMVEKGFSDVTDVDGGIAAWEAAQLPTVAGG